MCALKDDWSGDDSESSSPLLLSDCWTVVLISVGAVEGGVKELLIFWSAACKDGVIDEPNVIVWGVKWVNGFGLFGSL